MLHYSNDTHTRACYTTPMQVGIPSGRKECVLRTAKRSTQLGETQQHTQQRTAHTTNYIKPSHHNTTTRNRTMLNVLSSICVSCVLVVGSTRECNACNACGCLGDLEHSVEYAVAEQLVPLFHPVASRGVFR